MNNLKIRYLFYLVISTILFSCAAKESKAESNESSDSELDKSEAIFKQSNTKKTKKSQVQLAKAKLCFRLAHAMELFT